MGIFSPEHADRSTGPSRIVSLLIIIGRLLQLISFAEVKEFVTFAAREGEASKRNDSANDEIFMIFDW